MGVEPDRPASGAARSVGGRLRLTGVAAPVPADLPRASATLHPRKPAPAWRRPAYACCSYAALRAADTRLRRSYDRAIDAGVPRRVLVDYRERWADLRDDGRRHPDRLVRGYG